MQQCTSAIPECLWWDGKQDRKIIWSFWVSQPGECTRETASSARFPLIEPTPKSCLLTSTQVCDTMHHTYTLIINTNLNVKQDLALPLSQTCTSWTVAEESIASLCSSQMCMVVFLETLSDYLGWYKYLLRNRWMDRREHVKSKTAPGGGHLQSVSVLPWKPLYWMSPLPWFAVNSCWSRLSKGSSGSADSLFPGLCPSPCDGFPAIKSHWAGALIVLWALVGFQHWGAKA